MVSRSLSRKKHSLYPICDTNILIDLQLAGILNDFLEHKQVINIADKVKDEMSNIFSGSTKYENFLDSVIENDKILIIAETIFSEEEKAAIIHTLRTFSMGNFFNRHAYKKDVGEFASALYAIYLEIKQFYTNDTKFIDKYNSHTFFINLEMLNLNEVLSTFLPDKERISAMKSIEEKNPKMRSTLNEEKVHPLSRAQLLSKLASYAH